MYERMKDLRLEDVECQDIMLGDPVRNEWLRHRQDHSEYHLQILSLQAGHLQVTKPLSEILKFRFST